MIFEFIRLHGFRKQDDDIIVDTFYMQMMSAAVLLRPVHGVSNFLCVCVFVCVGMRQQNDRGTQYRSAIYTSNPVQQELALKSKVAFQQV